ncbi:30S ribosomal protein S17 [Candidatus Woesearchaeota archaeon]|nr:MAG: 30S ribosomal protein S17 [Candidatus Woesearchaeota archaeon]
MTKKEKSNEKKEKVKAPASVTVAGRPVRLRGRTFVGVVVSDKMTKTVTVEWERRLYVPKYERYFIRKSRVKAHNPEEVGAKLGDKVRIQESRPLSKTKKFVVTEIIA